MNWPIRYQVFFPMLGVFGAAIVSLCLVSSFLASNWVRAETDRRVASVEETLTASRIPLTDRVLEQVAGLSQSHYGLVDSAGRLIAASIREYYDIPPAEWRRLEASPPPADQRIAWRGTRCYHRQFPVSSAATGGEAATLHVFLPAAAFDAAWRRAVTPPLIVGGVALVVTAMISGYVARRVTAPLAALQRHVARVAQGDFAPFDPPARRDEIRELAEAVHQMTEKLEQYEIEVRRRERLEMLGRLGSSMAHQIRNAATGARMAIDVYRQTCEEGQADTEGIDLAREELRRIERFLDRFLKLGRRMAEAGERGDDTERGGLSEWELEPQTLSAVIASAIRHMAPVARHLGVVLDGPPEGAPCRVVVPGEPLEQALINLLRNGVEAAAAEATRRVTGAEEEAASSEGSATQVSRVWVACRSDGSAAVVEVWDNGPGPAASISGRMFEPFVSDKSGGAGLGLALVASVATMLHGEITWRRVGDETCFSLRFPAEPEEGKEEIA